MSIKRTDYIHGTSAEKIDYDIYNHNRVLKEKRQLKSAAGLKFRLFFVVVVALSLGLLVMYRYTAITELNFKISKLNGEYSRIINDNQSFRVAIDKQTNLSSISLAATDKLGMQEPDKYQINYIRIPKANYTVAKTIYEESPQSDGLFSWLAKLEGWLWQ